ncbi:MAG TPA: hypothetical protein VK203_03390 [Nostocaceae cyanobacterium]|nr:hypothetical protein [Nostocaceae cyanobacterium]
MKSGDLLICIILNLPIYISLSLLLGKNLFLGKWRVRLLRIIATGGGAIAKPENNTRLIIVSTRRFMNYL